jgi:hypothetical protein
MHRDPLVEAAMNTIDKLTAKIGSEAVRQHFPDLVLAVAKSMDRPAIPAHVPYSGSRVGFTAQVGS